MKWEAIAILSVLGVGSFFTWRHFQNADARRVDYDAVTPTTPLKEMPTGYKTCTVKKVADGDTITVNCGGQTEKIRFCGIDSPEKAQPLGKEATAHLQKLIAEANNQVEITEIERDRYGRMVAEVFTRMGDTEKFLNGEMVMSGMAYHYERYSVNCSNRESIDTAESLAKEQNMGVWAGNYQKPWDYRNARRR